MAPDDDILLANLEAAATEIDQRTAHDQALDAELAGIVTHWESLLLRIHALAGASWMHVHPKDERRTETCEACQIMELIEAQLGEEA